MIECIWNFFDQKVPDLFWKVDVVIYCDKSVFKTDSIFMHIFEESEHVLSYWCHLEKAIQFSLS